MISLPQSLEAWQGSSFSTTLKEEIAAIDHALLPLQQGLRQSSYVSDSPFSVVILDVRESTDTIDVKVGIFYAGVIAGSCCSDDPTPLDEQTEYCEVLFRINKNSAVTEVSLLQQ